MSVTTEHNEIVAETDTCMAISWCRSSACGTANLLLACGETQPENSASCICHGLVCALAPHCVRIRIEAWVWVLNDETVLHFERGGRLQFYLVSSFFIYLSTCIDGKTRSRLKLWRAFCLRKAEWLRSVLSQLYFFCWEWSLAGGHKDIFRWWCILLLLFFLLNFPLLSSQIKD